MLGAVQHRLRPMPQLQGGPHRRLPEHQPRSPRLGLRLRRHGRLGRRPGRVRDGPLRGLEPAQVPRQGSGDGEDPRPDDAQRHLPDRLSRLRQRRRRPGLDRLHRRGGPGRARRGSLGPVPGRGGRDRRRPASPSASSRRARSAARRSTSPRASPRTRSSRSSASRRSTAPSTPSASRPAATVSGSAVEEPADGPQLDHGRDQGRRQARHPGPLRHRRSRGGRRGRQGGLAVDPDRPRLGEVPRVHHRPVPGDALPPRPDEARS